MAFPNPSLPRTPQNRSSRATTWRGCVRACVSRIRSPLSDSAFWASENRVSSLTFALPGLFLFMTYIHSRCYRDIEPCTTRMTACLSPMFAAVAHVVVVDCWCVLQLRHWWTGGTSTSGTTPSPSTANPAATSRYPRLYGNSWFWLASTNFLVQLMPPWLLVDVKVFIIRELLAIIQTIPYFCLQFLHETRVSWNIYLCKLTSTV